MSPFEFFQREMNHVDVIVRTEAMKRFLMIAGLMPPAAVKNDLIPLLQGRHLLTWYIDHFESIL